MKSFLGGGLRDALIAIFAAALALPAPAQESARLAGLVRDVTGAVLVDVAVAATHEETGIRRTARSGGEGVWVIPAVAPGLYKITARKVGFRTVARLNVGVAPGEEARVDFLLPVGSIRETVTVEGTAPAINTEDASVATRAGKRLIEGLPLNGRGAMSLVELAPGVVATPASAGEAGQFSVNGQRANTNYFTVDGVSANNGVSGSSVPAQFAGGSLPGMTAFGGTQNLVSMEALEEVRIQTSTFAPEFGRMPGAQVAMTTRSGSDELHGSLAYSFRNDRLDAADRIAASYGLRRPPHRLNHWQTALGGPLRRHRTYFHAGYEGMRMMQPYAWRGVTPSAAARRAAPEAVRPLLDAFPLPTGAEVGDYAAALTAAHARPSRLDAGSLRIDHALNARWTLFARYNQAPSSTQSGYAQVSHSEFAFRTFTIGAMATAGANITSDLRVNASGASVRSDWNSAAAGGAKPVDLRDYLPTAPGVSSAMYGIGIGGLGHLLAGDSGRNRQGQWHVVETLAVEHGPHSLRFGADYHRLTPRRESASLSLAGSFGSLAEAIADVPMVVTAAQAEQAASLIETLSLFAQDTWRATPRLTLLYGVRWELTPAPAMRQPVNAFAVRDILPPVVTPTTGPGRDAPIHSGPLPAPSTGAPLWPTRYFQFAPRVGAAYRFARGPVLRAGWGLFYDLGFSAATDPINGFPYNRWQFRSGVPEIMLAAGESNGYRLGPSLRIPRAYHWNVALEHGLTAADVVTASYVGAAGRDLLRREGTRYPETGIAHLVTATNNGISDYHGLQLQYRRRMADGLQGVVSYAWSHSIDNGSWDSGVALAEPGIGPERDRGPSSFDVRHGFTAALSYAAPGVGSGRLRALTGDWTLHGMVRARSGFPIDVLAAENLLGLGFDNAPRPDLNIGVPLWILDRHAFGGRRLNPGAFSPARDGVQGSLGRNAITGFGMSQVDLAVARRVRVTEACALEFRLEAFNALNHANPADPVRYLRHPLFGEAASMLNLMLGSGTPHSGLTPAFQPGGARSVQLGVRLGF